jgi:peptidoglycan-associated lipoprotein
MRTRLLTLFASLLLVAACSSDPSLDGAGKGDGTSNQGAGAGSTAGQPAPGSAQEFAVTVGDRVFFDTDMSTLTTEGRNTLTKQAEWLKQYSTYSVLVEGHCDERGTREYNLALGERRANAVRNFLIAQGVDASRLETISYGKERPEVVGSNPAAWAQNRRAVAVLK